MKKKTAKQVWDTGLKHGETLTEDQVYDIVVNLYKKNLAEAWFYGMGWPEGFVYCREDGFLRKTAIPNFLEHNFRAVWFACRFLD